MAVLEPLGSITFRTKLEFVLACTYLCRKKKDCTVVVNFYLAKEAV